MKNLVIGVIIIIEEVVAGICGFSSLGYASEVNKAKGKQVMGSFSRMEYAVDGKKNTYAESGSLKESAQNIVVVLAVPKYIRKIVLYWDNKNYPVDYSLAGSSDFVTWSDIERSKYEVVDGKRVDQFSLDNKVYIFIRAYIKKAKKDIVKLSELEVFINEKVRFNFEEVKVVNISKYSAVIKFRTDLETMASYLIGESPESLSKGSIQLMQSKENKLKISGLLRGTRYYVSALARDCNGNSRQSDLIEFKTTGIPLPKFLGISVVNRQKDSVVISWKANVKCISYLKGNVGNTKSFDSKTPDYKMSGLFKVTGLIPDSLVNYRLESEDEFGNKVLSELMNTRTVENNVAEGRKIEGTFIYDGSILSPVKKENSISKIVDGDLSYETGSVMSGNIFRSDQHFRIDLGDVYKIEKIKILWFAGIYTTNYDIEVSIDNKNWKTIGRKVNPKKRGIDRHLNDGSRIIEMSSVYRKGYDARYIKVAAKKGFVKRIFPQHFNLRLIEAIVIAKPDRFKENIRAFAIE